MSKTNLAGVSPQVGGSVGIGVVAAGMPDMLTGMSRLADTARFRADDPDELVVASLACPLCLHREGVEWELDADGYDPSAQCLCRRCDESWRVFVTPDQALRLGLLIVGAQ